MMAGLHLGNFGIGVAQAAAAMAQHRIDFCQQLHFGRDLFVGNVHVLGQFALFLLEVGTNSCKGIEQADRHGMALHRLEQTLEVAALHRQ